MKKINKIINVKRSYTITSKELKKAFGIKGDIEDINLLCGRSPLEREEGKSAGFDLWEVNTIEENTEN